MSESHAVVPYQAPGYSPDKVLQRATKYRRLMEQRRSLRMFSDRAVSRQVIEK